MKNPKVDRAFNAMKALGLSRDRVKPVLKQLLKLYDKKWAFIEAENYRVLVDAVFEEDKDFDVKRKKPVDPASSEPPLKKLHTGSEEDEGSSTVDSGGLFVVPKVGDIPPTTLSGGRLETSDSYLVNNKSEPGSCSGMIKGKSQLSSAIFSDSEKFSERASSSSFSKLPIDESSTLPLHLEMAPAHCCSDKLTREDSKHCCTGFPLSDSISKIHSVFIDDITKGEEKVQISLVDEHGKRHPPKFYYIPRNIIYQKAIVNISLARISDEDCCPSCSGDCLSSAVPCACTRITNGDFAYMKDGLLKPEFLRSCISDNKHVVYCQDCPLERANNEKKPGKCKGHTVKKFIKECWSKCGCSMQCGNRVVQRGITRKLQVFWTPKGKGWGLRALEDLPEGAFVCEYVGEVVTNTELDERNQRSKGNERHTYPVQLDADWASESVLDDDFLLCLDATNFGNVARFINHRCSDANLIEVPVEVETVDHHYYHLAFFTTQEVKAYDELTWDYGLNFDDEHHPIKAFRCRCGSAYCRDTSRKGSRSKPRASSSVR